MLEQHDLGQLPQPGSYTGDRTGVGVPLLNAFDGGLVPNGDAHPAEEHHLDFRG
jgi:hypothetical protein